MEHADSTKKKKDYWPVLTSLLVTSTEDLIYTTTSSPSRLAFVENLRKGLKGNKPDVSILCAIRIFGASQFVTKENAPYLRILAQSLISPTCEKLFDTKNFYPKQADLDEQVIDLVGMYECVGYLMRLDPIFATTICNTLLDNNAPPHFKYLFVKGCNVCATERGNELSPPPLEMFDSTLRDLFRNRVNQTTLVPTESPKKAKKDKKLKELEIDYLADIIQLWINSPRTLLFNNATMDPLAEYELFPILGLLVNCISSPNKEVVVVACKLLTSLFKPAVISSWEESHNLQQPHGQAFWALASFVSIALCKLLNSLTLPDVQAPETLLLVVKVFVGILEYRNKYIFLNQLECVNAIARFDSTVQMESIFIVLLSSNVTDIPVQAGLCLSLLFEEVEICRVAEYKQNPKDGAFKAANGDGIDSISHLSSLADNFVAYRKLCLLYSHHSMEAFHLDAETFDSKIRACLRLATVPTDGSLMALGEMYNIWKLHLVNILKMGFIRQADELAVIKQAKTTNSPVVYAVSQNELVEWGKLSAMICAMGQLCIIAMVKENEPKIGHELSPQQEKSEDLSKGPGFIKDFIKELSMLVGSVDMNVRRITRDNLSKEISGGLAILLFQQFETSFAKLQSNEGEFIFNDRGFNQCDQVMTVIENLLARAEELYSPDPSNTVQIMMSTSNEVYSLVARYALYISGVSGADSVSVFVTKIKTCICRASTIMLKKKDLVGIRKEQEYKNQMLKMFMEWHFDFLGVSYFY